MTEGIASPSAERGEIDVNSIDSIAGYSLERLREFASRSRQLMAVLYPSIQEHERAYLREYRSKWVRHPKNQLSAAVSSGMRSALARRGVKKRYRTWESLAGYDIDALTLHMESQFTGGMSWDNYGDWHIDHIIPQRVFNFTSPDNADFKRCWALKNLRPMWARENQTKGGRVDKPFQPMLALTGGDSV